MTLHTLPTKDLWLHALQEVTKTIHAALKKYGHARIGLSGGRTPKHLYELLAQQNLPWDKITFILLDERCVPTTDPESNQGMIAAALPSAQLFAFDTTLPPEEATEQMTRMLITLSNERQPLFDLLILGAGKDGHVASLFDGDSALNATAYAQPATAKDYPTENRLTLTLMALQSSSAALLLLQGEEKRPVLQALKGALTPPLTALRHLMGSMPLTVLTDLTL